MPEKEKELLLALVSKTLNMDEKDAAASLYNEDGTLKEVSNALNDLLAKDAERISVIKADVKKQSEKAFDNGYSKAKAEVMPEFEKSIKEKFSIKSDKKGLELIEDLTASLTKTGANPVITDDLIKVSPVYLNAEKQWMEKEKSIVETYEKQINEIKGQFELNQTLSTVTSVAQKILFESVKPELPKSDIAKQTQLTKFFDDFKTYKYQINKDSKGQDIITVLDNEGKRVENQQGHPVPFELLVKEKAELHFDIPKQDARSSAQGTGKEGKFSFAKPKDDNEFVEQMTKISTDASLTNAEKTEKQQELIRIHRGEGG
jgi:hypothetical protein